MTSHVRCGHELAGLPLRRDPHGLRVTPSRARPSSRSRSPLMEVDRAAVAVARDPEQVAEILRYALAG
jgi:hypothetical protein